MKRLIDVTLTLGLVGLGVPLAVLAQTAVPAAAAVAASATAPSTDGSVAIQAISPPFTEPLVAGQRVRITAQVAYTQPGTGATIALSLQEPPPTQRPLGASATQVTGAAGVVTLVTELVVPDAPLLKVYVPLYTHSDRATAVVATGSYRVTPRP